MRDPVRRRLSRPWLIAAPTRGAILSHRSARLSLALIAATVLVVLAIATPPIDTAAVLIRDATLVERLRHDGPYYPIAADTLRSGGEALRPALAFPLPAVPVIVAALPPLASIALLIALAAGVAMAWQARLMPLCRSAAGQIVVIVLSVAGVVSAGQPGLIVVPETWAGLFVALALLRRRPGHWLEAAGYGLAAASLHGAAALLPVVMAVLAWRDGYRREAAGWAGALALLTGILAFHLHGVAGVLHPLDAGGDGAGWAGWLAGPFAIAAATGAAVLPASLGAAIAVLAALGWAAWRDPLAIRAGATLVVFAAVLASGTPVMGGLLVAPIALAGLVFIPDLLRDLAAAALDSRRITVTRSVR